MVIRTLRWVLDSACFSIKSITLPQSTHVPDLFLNSSSKLIIPKVFNIPKPDPKLLILFHHRPIRRQTQPALIDQQLTHNLFPFRFSSNKAFVLFFEFGLAAVHDVGHCQLTDWLVRFCYGRVFAEVSGEIHQFGQLLQQHGRFTFTVDQRGYWCPNLIYYLRSFFSQSQSVIYIWLIQYSGLMRMLKSQAYYMLR